MCRGGGNVQEAAAGAAEDTSCRSEQSTCVFHSKRAASAAVAGNTG